jgi:hypothetical protein
MTTVTPTTKVSLEAFAIPSEFSRVGRGLDSATLPSLEIWKSTALRGLSDLWELVKQGDSALWPLELQANVISAVASFDGEGAWIDDATRELANSERCCYFIAQQISLMI